MRQRIFTKGRGFLQKGEVFAQQTLKLHHIFVLRLLGLFRRFLARLHSQLANFQLFGTIFNFSISFWIHKVANRRAFPKCSAPCRKLARARKLTFFSVLVYDRVQTGQQEYQWFITFSFNYVWVFTPHVRRLQATPGHRLWLSISHGSQPCWVWTVSSNSQ